MLTAPDVFDQDDEGGHVIIRGDPGRRAGTDVRFAAELCPGNAIGVTD